MIRLKLYAIAAGGVLLAILGAFLAGGMKEKVKAKARRNSDRLKAIKAKQKVDRDAENKSDDDLIDSISK